MPLRAKVLLLLFGLPASFPSLTGQNLHSSKVIPVSDDCSPRKQAKCGPTVKVATPEELYDATAKAIVELREGEFGFPVDIAVAAFGMKHLSGTRDLHVVEDLQSIKRYGPTPSLLPTLFPADIPGLGRRLYPAELIRALFMTELFPSVVEVVEWRPKQATPESKVLYILLDKSEVTGAGELLKKLAGMSSSRAGTFSDSENSENTVLFPRAALVTTAYSLAEPSRTIVQQGAGQTSEHSGPLADPKTFPHVTLDQVEVKMTIDENRWNCGSWEDIVHTNGSKAVTSRLGQLGGRGCILGLYVKVPRGIINVIAHIVVRGRILGQFGETIRCSPDEFEDPFATNVNKSDCTNGLVKWDFFGEAISKKDQSADALSYVSIAVPYFNSTAKRPNIALGISLDISGDSEGRDNRGCWSSNSTPSLDACIAQLDN